jgi:hypothetical protein
MSALMAGELRRSMQPRRVPAAADATGAASGDAKVIKTF